MKNKSIDINQRIPLDTLYIALESYLDDNYSNDYVLEQLRLEFDGENRLKKALRIVNKVIQRNPLNGLLLENSAEVKTAIKKKVDRDIILIALLNSAFPFSFDVLQKFGKFFAVQEVVNTETMKKSISNVYGGNRATENGLYSVIPMFLEAGFFKRPKQGIYEWTGGISSTNKITNKIYIESFKVNNPMAGAAEGQLRDPYFKFVEYN
ncbi:hypothetical protein [Aequorivita marina]|uniref:hypothetical protein n=1 Tax=Aequorivita marina TaxID=3073654 RepID=UPI00287587DF|nr:hypothetical protein [Aequorivita sp. S2608]MDS1299182.1 hypothetical protein [Aequorivita sp. S2608]